MASGYLAAREAVDKLLADVGGLLADLTSAETPDADAEAEDARRVIDAQVSKFWQGYYELKRRHDESALSVAVLALTKSGKSTLLNSLMGMHVLPMNNVPETARIIRIQHDPAAKEPTLREGVAAPGATSPGGGAGAGGGGWGGRGRSRGSGEGSVVRGEGAVRARLQQLNSAARTSSGPLSPRPSGGLGLSSADGSGSGEQQQQQQPQLLPEGLEELLAGGSGGAAAAAAVGPVGPAAASSVLHITAPLMGLEGWGAEMGRVCLLDTPGPNEAGEEQLKHQVERLLEGVDCVLYLLDYTKLKTAEEEGLFRRLRAINPQLVARLSSRLFFIVNKVDACETSEGLDPDQVREYVADLVTRQLGGAAAGAGGGGGGGGGAGCGGDSGGAAAGRGSGSGGEAAGDVLLQRSASAGAGSDAGAAPFRLHPDQVLLLSARNALLARLVLSGRAGPEDLQRFRRLAFGAFGAGGMGGGGGGRGPAAAGPSAEAMRAAAGCLLEGSGVCELEGRVLSFLAAHAGAVKLLATADDLTRLLGQVRNVALACRSCLQRNVAVLQAQVEGLRRELAEAAAAFEEVRGRADAVQTEVVGEIKAHLSTLRRRLFTQIVQALDTDAHAPPPPARSSAPAARWFRVRDKFLSMFTAASSSLPPGSGPSALVPQARSRSRDELAALLLDLHDDLMSQIHSEVSDFWGVLEACAASRHAELLSALNTHLAALSRRVEGAVSEALQVRLDPADIRLRPPSAEELHSDVAELIEKGIRESNEKHIRVGTRTTTERQFRQPAGPPSLCRWGGYWVDVPRTRTVVETYSATVYCLRPEEIANHFIGLVDGAVSASEAALGAYVAALVEAQLAAARERIREYGDRYLDAMNAALAVSARGAEFRGAALAAVDGYLGRLEQLAARGAATQAAAEAAVPGAAAGLMDEVEVYEDMEEEQEEQEQVREEVREEEEREAAAPPPPPELHDLEAAAAAAAAAAVQMDLLLPADEELEVQQAPGDVRAAAADGEVVEGEDEEERVCAQPVAAASDVLGAALEAELEALYGGAVTAGGSGGVGGGAGVESHEEQMRQLSAALSAAMADSVFTSPPAVPEAAEAEAAPAAAMPEAVAEAVAAEVLEGAIPDIDDLAEEEEGLEGWSVAQSGQGSEMVVVAEAQGEEDAAEAAAPEAIEAPPQLPQAQEEEDDKVPAAEAEAAAPAKEVAAAEAVPAAEQPTAAGSLPAAPSMSSSAYTGAPFDYSRAFIEAMSSSEMGASLAPAAPDEPLTMIPLTSAEDAARGAAARAGAAGGVDSPRSAASSGDWQLVGAAGEDELDVAAGEPVGPVAGGSVPEAAGAK